MNTLAARRPARTLIAMTLCMALQMTAFVTILPLFARRFDSLGAGVTALGISAMAYALTSTCAAPVVGMLADRCGRRPVILLSLAACVLAFSGYLLASAAWLIILLRGLAGLFTAGLVPAIMSMVGDLAPAQRRGQWIGIVSGGASAGWIAGPLLGGLLYDRFGYAVPFAVAIALATAALLVALCLIPETHTPAAHPDRAPWARGVCGLSARATLLPLLIAFGGVFAWAFIEPQFMYYVYDDLRWSSSQLGMVMSTFGVAGLIGEFTLGQLSDHWGRKPVLLLGLALFSAQFVGLVLFRDPRWIVVSFFVAGLGNALYDPALSALLLDLTPAAQSAGVMGIKSMVGAFGNLLGPALVVLVAPVAGAQGVFLIAAVLVVAISAAVGVALPPAGRAVAPNCPPNPAVAP